MEKKGKKNQSIDPGKAVGIAEPAEKPALKTTDVQEKTKQQNTPNKPHMLFR